MIDNKQIGSRLKSFREAIKPSPPSSRQFALRANIDPSQYGKLERGEIGLGTDKIEELCSTWNINKDWLFTGKGEWSNNNSAISAFPPAMDVMERLLEIEARMHLYDVTLIELLSRVHKKSTATVASEFRKAILSMRETLRKEYGG